MTCTDNRPANTDVKAQDLYKLLQDVEKVLEFVQTLNQADTLRERFYYSLVPPKLVDDALARCSATRKALAASALLGDSVVFKYEA